MSTGSRAQTYSLRTYTTDDGLPANNLYNAVRDHRGFLWFGSENGLVRFDGNNFRTYTVSDGLPDNEIVSLQVDADGILWALPYREPPAFYNPLTDRFVIADVMPASKGLSIRTQNGLDVLDNGGIALHMAGGATIVARKGRLQRIPAASDKLLFAPTVIALSADRFLLPYADSFRIYRNERQIAAEQSPFPCTAHILYYHGVVYGCDSFGLYKAILGKNGSVAGVAYRSVAMNPAQLQVAGRHLALIRNNGTEVLLIDTATLAVAASLPLGGALASSVLEDERGHVWVTSSGRGLLKLSATYVTNYQHLLPPDMVPATVAVDGATLLCGDDKGRIAIFRRGCVEQMIDISKWSKAVSRIRNIIVLKDGYYVAVEGDASMLLDRQYNIISLYNRPLLNYSDRCAALWHDSIILAGSHTGAAKFLYKNCQALDVTPIRTTAIGADKKGRLIIGTAEGCYRRDDTGLYSFGKHIPELASRVSTIYTTPDGLVWIGLATDRLVVLQDDDVAGIIRFENGLKGTASTALCGGRNGEVWLGTDRVLSRIGYTLSNGKLEWKAFSFGAAEGLPGRINSIAWQNDSVYTTTSQGVYSMPAGLSPDVHDIPVYITGIRINDRDTSLETNWKLPYYMNDIDVHFSGIDMDGFAPTYQYAINGDAWQEISEDHLVLKRLQPGSYRIRLRALRRDGNPSSSVAELNISLRTPFWRSIWFWLGSIILLAIGTLIGIQWFFRRKREKQLRRLSAEHELVTAQQQTFSALMNPHFIFNALNSIQHYVLAQDKRSANRYLSGFGRLIRMNFETAQKSFTSLEEELERLQLYLGLEQMRFGDHLAYSIKVDESVAPEDWQIPAMLIQPYVENALLHGIAPARHKGQLDIHVARAGESLCVTIRDNGIGIANSMQLKNRDRHGSHSMDLIQRRVALLRRLGKQRIDISVAAAYPDDAVHPGTLVNMLFGAHVDA